MEDDEGGESDEVRSFYMPLQFEDTYISDRISNSLWIIHRALLTFGNEPF